MRNTFSKAALVPVLFLSSLQVQAANWELDPAESKVTFMYSYEGTPYQGEFQNVQATFDIDPTNPGSCNFVVTIQVSDIKVDSAEVLDSKCLTWIVGQQLPSRQRNAPSSR